MGAMVDEGVTVELREYWFPTKASVERFLPATAEYNLNHRTKGQAQSLAEAYWSSGSPTEALALLPAIMPAKMRREMRRLLHPWPEGRYTEAYGRTGGILNLFTPPWDEQQDEVWAEMVAGWEAERFAGEGARQAALRALEARWNQRPHPFFAGLTPAQVMAGGGREESELAAEFLGHLADEMDGQGFNSDGEALIQTLMLLRAWQSEPRADGRTVLEIVRAERDELLARRARALQKRLENEDE